MYTCLGSVYGNISCGDITEICLALTPKLVTIRKNDKNLLCL